MKAFPESPWEACVFSHLDPREYASASLWAYGLLGCVEEVNLCQIPFCPSCLDPCSDPVAKVWRLAVNCGDLYPKSFIEHAIPFNLTHKVG